MIIESVLKEFGLHGNRLSVIPISNGLINNTWKVEQNETAYILQKVNDAVFQKPEDIASNIAEISMYLQKENKDYFFVAPVTTLNGGKHVHKNEQGYFRVFPFVKDSHTINVVQTPEQAYEAAKQFGKFSAALSGFDWTKLKITIPDFHNLSLRYKQFIDALQNENNSRIKEAEDVITTLKSWSGFVNNFEDIKRNYDFKLRVTHHDTKISNVLFNSNNKGICVIDLDTVMPGYFISDVGDMIRTYLCPVSEEETDFSKIEIRPEFYKAIVAGYLGEMENELTQAEKTSFFYGGVFMIYMQALRFITDYLNNDIYYGAKYPQHNLVRAGNQTLLLQRLLEMQPQLETLH